MRKFHIEGEKCELEFIHVTGSFASLWPISLDSDTPGRATPTSIITARLGPAEKASVFSS